MTTPARVRPRSQGDWINRGIRAVDLVLVARRSDGVDLFVPKTPVPAEGWPHGANPRSDRSDRSASNHAAKPSPERAAEERLLRRIAADRGGWPRL